jgi:hypothetical protein
VQFVHTFKSEEEVFFALSFPFSYKDSLDKCKNIVEKFKSSKTIYAHHETAIHTLEGRKMQLLTISSFKNITNEREDLILGLFPEHSKIADRPFK